MTNTLVNWESQLPSLEIIILILVDVMYITLKKQTNNRKKGREKDKERGMEFNRVLGTAAPLTKGEEHYVERRTVVLWQWEGEGERRGVMAPEINNRAVIACGAIPYFIRAISHNLGGNYREYVIYHCGPGGSRDGRWQGWRWCAPLLRSTTGMGDGNYCGQQTGFSANTD